MRKVVPEGRSLFPYQREGVKQLCTMRNALLAYEMGLGKCPITICVSNIITPQHMVVVCPAVVRSTWEMELSRWDTLGRAVLLVHKGNQPVSRDINVIIVSYDLAASPKWADFLSNYLHVDDKSMLVLDESHYIKSWTARRTKVIIKKLVPSAKRLFLLTGTPMTKNVADLHPQLCALQPNKWGKLNTFCSQYAYAVPTPFGSGVEYRGLRNVEELKEKLKPIMLRCFKKDVLKDLPEKTYSNIYLEVDKSVATKSLTLVNYVMKQLEEEGYSVNSSEPDQEHIAAIRHSLGIAKIKPIIAWLDLYLDTNPDEPLVIFAYHKAVVAALTTYFNQKGISSASITGATSQKDRTDAINNFQNGTTQVIIGNLIAAGTGITLTRASTAIMCEVDWSPAVLSQAINRIHRVSQTKHVMIYFMLAKNSLDDHIVEILQTKMKDIESCVGGAI